MLYLLDTNVFREMGARGNVNVQAWLKTIDDDQIRVSPVVYREMRQGWESERVRHKARGKDSAGVDAALAALDQFEQDYADRQAPITMAVQRELTRLLGAKGKNANDLTLAATAKLHGFVVVTRNVKDFAGCGVRVLNPFTRNPTVEIV